MNFHQILWALVPRFIVDDVGGYFEGDEFVPLGSVEFYNPEIDSSVTHVARLKTFTWLGWSLGGEGAIYTLDEWLELFE